jgi:hypothetical protein
MPAVPPPPVDGAAVGKALADRLAVGDGLIVTGGEVVTVTVGNTVSVGDGVTVGDTVTVGDGVADVPGKGLVLVVGVVPLPAVPLAVADPVTEGEKMAGEVGDEPPEHAEIPTEASTVRTPKPTAVSRVLSTVPAMGVRTFMEPPRGARQVTTLFPDPASETFPDPGLRNRRR